MTEKKEGAGTVLLDQIPEKKACGAGKFLTFKLAEEEYGLAILKVKEIIGLMIITQVPRTPEYIRGVINLRGKVIPVIDLRVKFQMMRKEDTQESCIIVVDMVRDSQTVMMGLLVDSVSEVLDIPSSAIEDTPSFGVNVRTDFILGMGKIKERVIMLLDIDQVMTSENIQALEQIVEV